jgi:hypothetical protein
MSPPPTSIDGTDITGATIDGQDVQEITVDGQTVFTAGVPDFGDVHSHFDVSDKSSIFPLRNETSEGDLPAGGSPTLLTGQKNGLNVVSYDGVDDFHEGGFTTAINPPFTLFFAFKFDVTVSGNNISLFSANDESMRVYQRNSDLRINAGNDVIAGNGDTNWHIAMAYFDDGTDSVIRIDGVELARGNAGQTSIDELAIGYDDKGRNHADVKLGEVIIYPLDKRSIDTEVEAYLSNRWNIPV